MADRDLTRMLEAIHEHHSIGDILDALVVVCMICEQREGDQGNEEDSALYARATAMIESLDDVDV